MLKKLFEKRREKKVFSFSFFIILILLGFSFVNFPLKALAQGRIFSMTENKYPLFFSQKKEACVSYRFGETSDRIDDCPLMKTTETKPEVKAIVEVRKPSIQNSKVNVQSKTHPSAQMPVSAKKVNGRLVCAKKKDKPGKSKKNKKKHLDLECCLDPDEYPNPHCYYPPEKYGKYL